MPRLHLCARVPECPSPLLQALSPSLCPQVYLGAVFLGSCPGVCVPRCPSTCPRLPVPPPPYLLCPCCGAHVLAPAGMELWGPTSGCPCASVSLCTEPPWWGPHPCSLPPWGHRRTPQAPGGRRCHSRKKGTGSSSILVLVPSRRGHQPRRATRNTSCIARDTARRGPSWGCSGGPHPRWRVSSPPTPQPTTTGPPRNGLYNYGHQTPRRKERSQGRAERGSRGERMDGCGGGAFAGTAVAPSPLPPHTFWG